MAKGLSQDVANIFIVTEFLLLGFSEFRELQLVRAAMFLLFYLVALTRNLLIVIVISLDRLLRYGFIMDRGAWKFDIISPEISNISTLFLVALLPASEFLVLTAMSYNHYIAICLPLRYEVVVKPEACGKIAVASWISGGLFGILFSASIFSLPFYRCHKLHFHCRLMRTQLPGRPHLLAHLIVVTLFLSTGVFDYLKPPLHSSSVVRPADCGSQCFGDFMTCPSQKTNGR
ncbi:olfactory receptor 14J1-like [Tachyglossus aculeatus]|uniref:olfactory receptor 14J1-like n=1 Tax=Tachyglossus aculeatus TaxID=9261 RepID=UPI0018F69DE1|nr:olfactory receptor 14J1-like [Tachyglossus aculeatus]